MAIISVPRNVRGSGKVIVTETPKQVEDLIDSARVAGRQIIVLHALTREGGSTEEFRVKWSLCQAIENDQSPVQVMT